MSDSWFWTRHHSIAVAPGWSEPLDALRPSQGVCEASTISESPLPFAFAPECAGDFLLCTRRPVHQKRAVSR